jgi:hypothetical protein
MSDNPLKPMKLFPRNLTAHADVVVRGNPVTSRPESGVENCWPGLEFDHRNLEKAFFPGLMFEFHNELATILREFDPKGPAAKFFKKDEIAKGIYLAFVQGNIIEGHISTTPSQQVFSFIPPAGLENWRVVRDFEPGPVAVALCNQEVYNRVIVQDTSADSNNFSIDNITEMFTKRKNRKELGFVLLFADLAKYIDDAGVIDTALIPPGHLTRSMCSPWQYDFTDCGCFFWASNKPDLVAGEDQPLQILNFQRKDRSGDKNSKPTDWILKNWDPDRGKNWDNFNALGHVDIINHFNDLKFVVHGRERDEYIPVKPPQPVKLLTRQDVIDRLNVLAGVEHALCVEYLYAYYSLKLPPGFGPKREPWVAPDRPSDATSVEARIYTAADEILRVAIDEMRHFRWVNEMLGELGQPWVLDRAKIIGIDFPEMTKPGFNKPFALEPLTEETLNWFIDVEAASPDHDAGTIDGMYTRILISIEQGPAFQADPDERDRLANFVKLIIDEGVDHFIRFTRVKNALAGIPESEYLRVTTQPTAADAASDEGKLQATADLSYEVLLKALDFVFKQGRQQRGGLLEAARRGMYNVDEACRALSERGQGALFKIPPSKPTAFAAAPAAPMSAHEVGDPLRPQFDKLRTTSDPKLHELADRMQGKLAELTAALENASRDT